MNFKTVLFGLVTFALGGVVGYSFCKQTLTDQYQEDIEEVKNFYYDKLRELGVEEEDSDKEVLEITEEDSKEYYNRVIKNYDSEGLRVVNYTKPPLALILEDMEQEEDDEEDEDDELRDFEYEAELEARATAFAERKAENRKNGEPYVISYDEYMDAPEEYEREYLYYYLLDRTLCQDDDSVVEDEVVVGLDYEDVLDMQTTAWVRNDILNKVYEIHRIDESYSKSIAGLIETPREREFRVKGRRKQALDD